MTPESQRIAIAEACGWKEVREREVEHPTGGLFYAPGWLRGSDYCKTIPDYLNDLNACREMEKALDTKQRFLFLAHLSTITGFDKEFRFFVGTRATEEFADYCWSLTHATAAQRCEAFLRTLGLWKE